MLKKTLLMTVLAEMCVGIFASVAMAKDQDRTQDKDQVVLQDCTQFIDLNGDGIYDNSGCIDSDGDGVCDTCPCGAQTRPGR